MKRILLAFFVLGFTMVAKAQQQWIDITEKYVKNPTYANNNYSYWEGTRLSGANPMENAEHFNKKYDTYQTITGLKAGKYRVSLKAFYRMGTAQQDYTLYASGKYSDNQYAQLYASSEVGSYNVPIVPACAGLTKNPYGGRVAGVGKRTDYGGGWVSYQFYIPDDMEAAAAWFEAGYYKNTLDCEVGEDGTLTIGIRKNLQATEDWTCIDDWKLEYWGEVVKVSNIAITPSSLSLIPMETKSLSFSVTPEDATYPNVKWSSSNTNVATVDNYGNVTGVGVGTASIYATAIDAGGAYKACTVTVEAPAVATSENVIINEVMAANVDVYRDPSTNFGSWVELYNPTDKGVALGGLYVTDDATNLKKHRLIDKYGALPPKGFAILNFDHFEVFTQEAYRQINDKLDCDGGTIIISDGTNKIAEITYPEAISRVSYARTKDGGDEWGTTDAPTPGTSNSASTFATKQLKAPVVDVPAKLFTSAFSINVTIPEGATLRYTVDGSAPTLTNGLTSTTGTFPISSSISYRFRLFQDGMLASPVVTRTYIKDNGNEPFPIISIVTDLNNLFGDEIGLFSYSDYGRPGNGQNTKYNGNMDWDRPVNFEYITTNNECVISQECDYSACGGWSRAWSPHSFKLKAGKAYELNNTFNYQFFGSEKDNPAVENGKGYLKHKTLQIRNGGNDTNARIKDAAMQQIIASSGLYVEHQAWQPVHVYINGMSYAVLNMREPNNKHYGYANYGIDTDQMDQFEICPDSGYIQKEGTKDAFRQWYKLSKTAATEESYNEICKLVDIDEYVNYMATELYLGSDDWPHNNVKAFRDQNDGKFRFVLFDLDFAQNRSTPLTDFFNEQYYKFNALMGFDYSKNKKLDGTTHTMEIEFVTIFKNMLANDTFRKKFIDAYCLVAGSVFEPNRVKDIVNAMSDYLGQGGYVYPSGSASEVINGLSARQTQLINHLKNCSDMKLSNTTAQTVTLSSTVDGASILVNGMEVPTGKFSGRLFSPITLKATAPAGYRFLGWKSAAGSAKGTTIFDDATTWDYYDKGALSGDSWKSAKTVESWKSGKGPIGYGKEEAATKTTANLPTYYFHKTFTLSEYSSTDTYTLNYIVDDGMIVYVNGKEVGRYNMPSDNVGYNTLASTFANGNPDAGGMQIPASFLKKGENVIAVEVHNNNTTSTDILWSAMLVRNVESDVQYISKNTEFEMPSTGNMKLTAVWEKADDDKLSEYAVAPIKINEVSAGNDMLVNDLFKKDDWVELYNTTDFDLNVNGLNISDNADKPTKYQIEAPSREAAIIPAHGHLIVWCSKREAQSQIHANFKLANDEGNLVLISASDEFIANNAAYFEAHPQMKEFTDTLYYGAMAYDQTVGRYPDGGNSYYLFNHQTIAYANSIQPSDVFVGKDKLSAEAEFETTGIVEVLASNTVQSAVTSYYTLNGVFVGRNLKALPRGIYIEVSGAGKRKIMK
jgi:hypothetical protein